MAEGEGTDSQQPKSDASVFPNTLSMPTAPLGVSWWYLAAPTLGLLGVGAYSGYRKQMKPESMLAPESTEVQGRGFRSLDLSFNPTRHAARALAYGTALCLGCSAVGVMTVGYLMGVRNLREFSDKMNSWAPEKMRELGFRHSPQYIEDQKVVQGMTAEEEMSFMSDLFEGKPRPSGSASSTMGKEQEEETGSSSRMGGKGNPDKTFKLK